MSYLFSVHRSTFVNFVFSVFLYPKNDPTVHVISEADEVTEGNDGKYELFNQVDKQIKEGIKNLIDNCKFSDGYWIRICINSSHLFCFKTFNVIILQ